MSQFQIVMVGLSDDYPEGSSHHFNKEGLLVAVNPDRRRRVYSPSGWLYIEDTAPEPQTRTATVF